MAKKRKKKATTAPDGARILARNRRVFHDYEVSSRIEAGIALVGSEVKSLREQRCSLAEGYVEIRGGEAWLVNATINEYPWANRFNHDPKRERKLLLHKREITKLGVKSLQRGFTLVPLSVYLKNGRIKVEIGVARGKRQYEKREATRQAEAKREIDREARRER